ncbi:unnamed protein product [Rotaria sordida]|uniref:aldehyde dehydrogenase (NAD(+)) n=1 Tax=Rotaria sordida TaxID=392033 RepID=A0A813RVM0_9BILA|nr:unnamed protein product [Rotaria sordida]
MLAWVCGNTCVWKPSEKTPLTAIACQHILKSVFERNGVPEGVSGLITGGAEVGIWLTADARVPLISATGSTRMGKAVAQTVGSRLGKSLLELGGNNAIIARQRMPNKTERVGAMDLPEPYAYQMINGKEVKVDAAYALNDKNQLTFTLGSYDTSKPLIIDPIALRWATWVNSNSTGDNHGHGIWVDPSGNIYMVARVDGSTNLITTGAFDTSSNGSIDIIVGKYTEPGTVGGAGVRVWQTYIGGTGSDNPYVTEMGPDGNLYMAGQTGSTDFPVTGGTGFTGTPINHQSQTGDDIFVLKINPTGTGIKSAVIGGNGTDNAFDLRIATNGDVIVGGFTTSTNLLTQYAGSGAVNSNAGGNDAFLFRINQNLDAVSWVRNFGGSGNDQINILVNNPTTGDIFVGGNTASTSGITAGTPRQGTMVGSSTAFLRRYNSAGTVQWGSYFNSVASGTTSLLCMEFNTTKDRLYFAGITTGLGTNNTPSGTYDASVAGTNDFYVAHMNIDQTFYASTYIGSSGSENNLMGLNVDDNNDVYLFGYVGNDGYPTAGNPLQSARSGSTDKVFSKINSVLTTLQYSTYYGGTSNEEDPVGQRGIKFANCRIYTIVTARSTDVPLTQGAVTTTKTSSTSIYEPGIVEWANPPDLTNNSISASQNICSGSTPTGLDGQTPSYVLPSITRNGTITAHPSVGAISSYQWQSSPDNTTWSNIVGATGEDLTGAQIGALTQTTYFRRIINGDYCTVSAQTNIQVTVFTISGTQVNNTCFGGAAGSINVTASGAPGTVTYNWGGGITTEDRTGLAAGTYTVTATSGGCTATATFTITAPAQMSFTATPSSATCGAANGSITVSSPTGGTSPYQYSINGTTYQNGLSFTGLTAGTYTVYMRDNTGCVRQQSVTVSSANALVASVSSQTNVLCFGATTGSVTLSQTGGTAPYQYQQGSGSFQSSATFNGLASGTYTFTVRDANSCTATITVTITQPSAAVSASAGTPTHVLCFGGSNGAVTISGSGGTSPYTYRIGSGSYQSSGAFTGLTAGTYTFTVRDNNNCTATVNVTINQPAAALAVSTGSIVNVLCRGAATGSATATATGGTTAYSYSWNTSPVQTSATATGLAAGTYTVTVTDANGCQATATATITQPGTNVSGSITSQTNVLCFGNSTGSVTVAGAGGVSPYQYSFNGGTYQSSGTFGSLAAGTYTVTVRDANGCTSPVSVTITQPASGLTASIGSQTNVLCFGQSTGAVTINATGGTLPYTYQLGGGSIVSTNTFTGLAAGTYVITVRDGGNCSTTVNVTITQPPSAVSGSITSQTNVACNGGNGSVTVAGAGGVAPYQYSFNGGTYQSSGTFSNLSAGSYTVTVRDANNCTSNVPVTITQPSNLSVALVGSPVNVLCFGNSTGSFTVAGSGGTSPYQYSNNGGTFQSSGAFTGLAAGSYVVTSTGSVQINGAGGTSPYEFRIGSGAYGTSNSFTGLAAGTYTFTVRDANGCTATTSVTITQPGSAVDAVNGPHTNVLCFGNSTGSATAVGTGGVSPYTFNINGGAFQASATFNGLGAGTYTLGVRDANGCTDFVTVTITQPAAALNASANVTNASCAGSTNGSVIITPTGGTAPYQYQLGSGSFQSGNSFAGLSAGSYTVTVRDNNNCTYVVNFTVSELSSTVSGSISSQTNVLCFGASTGAVTVAGSGGVLPYQYSINGGTFQGSGSFTGLAAGNGGVGPYQYSLNGGTYQVSGIFTGLAAGSYVVTVKDNNNCTGTVNVTISQPSTPVAGSIVSQTNVLCFGQATGSVTVSGSGGVGPYQFNINGGSFSASNTFSNLAAGIYTVLVRDANGCFYNLPVTITQPNSPVTGSIIGQTNASCLGATGSVTVAGSGGTGPYQYSLNGGAFQPIGIFVGLSAGTYTVTVRDANGCIYNVPVNITQPADAVTGSITAQTNVSCYGGNNGAVTVTGNGGVAPYTYSFEGGAYSSTNSFTGLTAGSYDVTVRDNNGCLFVVSVNITQPSAPLSVAITSQTNVSCFGGSNGSVTVIGSGGTPAYVYRIGLGSYQSSGTFNNLAAGTYTITVRDSKLCTSTVTVVITQPTTPVTGTSDDVVPVACYGDASGSFVVIGAGGVAPYTYSFNGGAFNSSNSYVGLAAGTYSVVVRDANGCTSPAVVVTITQPNGALSANVGNQTNILCYGAATGSFSINANGGTAPYQFSLNGGAYNSSNVFANLTAGIYLVVVRDANGCTSSPVVVTLTQPNAPLSGSITNSTNVLCFGAATGSATVVAVGGVQPYSYSWNTTPAQTGNTATGLTAGTYTVTVTDFNGCSIQRTVTISQPATPISAAITNITPVSCFGGNNGSATVTASGGTGALSYSWNTTPVQHTATATSLTAGNYIVTITDGNGCTTTRPVTITQPASSVTAALVSQTNVSCFGDNNGAATITASGGTAPIVVTWNTVPQQTGLTASNLTPGTYIATATDANGCNASVSVTITGPSQPLASSIISSTNVTCFGYNNGVAVVSATGGTMPYSYSWSTTPVQTTQVASGLAPGTYIVVITDAHNCITTSSVTITGPAAPVAVSIINSVNVACRGEASGSATASASGGTGSLSYTWNTVPAQTGPTATGLVAGTYVVTVVDAFGCSAFTTVTITQPATVLTASLVNSGNPTCYGATNGFATVTATGGNGPYSIVWNTVPQQVGPTATNLGAGNYVAAVTDANGCTRFVNVTLTQPLAAMSGSIINSQNVLCFGDSTGSATVSVSGGTTPYTYSWNSIPSQTGSTATGLPAGTYVVTVTDAMGCSIQRSVTITQPATPISVALVNQHNVTCYGFSNGSATVTASGGTGALSYVWNTVPQQVGTSATNLVAGTYVVTVTDVFGCFRTLTVTITQPAAPLSAVINDRTNVLCFGQSTGSATVTVSGGTTAYSYSWNTNPVQTTQTASNLPAGTYIVTVTDANGCVTSASTVISQPATAVNASITNSTNILCFGNATGSATVSAIGGTPGYTYLWNTVPAQTGSTATGLVAGTYNVTVTDANGCFVVRTVTITQPNAPLSASITNSVNVCPTFATGSATVTPSGGTPNYLYTWSTVPAQHNATATGLAAGTYTVTVTDANGCTTTATAVINNNPKPLAGGDQNICQKVSAVVPAGQGEIWSSAPGNPAPAVINQAGAISGMNTGGIYLFILTNQFGCADTVAVTTTANCPLIANPDNAVTNEDTPVAINVPGNDVDPDGNINNGSVVITDQPDHGTVTINPVTGVITYTPNANYNGPDSFIYNICDTGMPVYCDTALVTINVIPVNDPPVANTDTTTTPEDTPVVIEVPDNDTDPEGGLDTTSVTIIDPPNHGTVVVDTTTGDITYTPDPNYNGPDTLIYSICDQGMPVLCDTAMVIINVTPVNDPPIANLDVTSTPEDTPVPINVPVNDTDVDGNLNVGSVTITDQPNNGTATVDPVTGIITYTPNNNFNGVDTLIYNICDTGLPIYCDTALVVIFVGPVNDPPVANIDHATTPEDVPVPINVPGNDTDNDGNLDPTSVTIVDQPNHGSVTVDPVTGVIIYTPNPNFNGVDSLIYNICDSGIPPLCDTALVIINVTPVNDPPVANIDHASTNEDTQVTIPVPSNDTDVDGNLDVTTVVITDQPNHGTATVNPVTGVITYTPNNNFNGVDTLIYNICDTGIPVYCDTALVIINVIPVNDPPIANPDPTTTPEDTPVTIHVPDNDTDTDDGIDSTTVTIVYPPNHGTVVVDTTTGDIIYTPDPNYNGQDTLIYNICDLDVPAMCDTAIVIITITPVNDPPIANIDHSATGEDTPVTIHVPSNDTDVDGNLDPTSVTIVDQPNNGTVTVDPVTGDIIYTPNLNFNGVDTLIYNICDTGMPVLCDTALVIISVDPNNDPPVANQDNAFTGEDMPVTIQVPGNDTDPDGNLDPTSVTIVDQPNNGTVTVDPVTGAIVYTPNPNFNGVDTLIYNICDTGMPVMCDTALVIIFVDPINDPPIANLDNVTTPEDTPVTIDVPSNDTDVDGNLDPTSVVIVDQPSNGTVTVDPVTGDIIYTPNLNFNGVDTLIYNICDTGMPVYCDTALVIINVTPVNDPPIANEDNATTGEDMPVTIDLPSNDTDVDGNLDNGSVTIVTPPANGTVVVNPNGSIVYTPNPNFWGNDSLIYNICDTGLPVLCDTAWVFIHVESNNDPLIAILDTTSTPEDTPVTIQVPDNDIDVDNNIDYSSVTIILPPANGTISGIDPVTVVTDLNGCTTTQTVTLTAPPALEVGGVAFEYNGGVNVSCANACDGSIDLTITGGVAPFAISWTGPNNFSSSSEDISGLCPGAYVVTVVDANNCSTTTTITLIAPQPLTSGAVAAVVAGGFNITCNGACNGSINATIGGGTTPYTISWTGPNNFVAVTEDIANLCAGTYNLNVTDANGCTTTSTVTLTQPEVLSATAIAALTDGGTNISCNGTCDGTIDMTVTGGVAPYTISWTGPGGFVSSSQDISSLCVGTYVATVTDANGCTASVTMVLTGPTPLVSTGVQSTYTGGFNISCNGGNNGSIDVTTTGGSGTYTFNWSGPGGFSANTEDIANLYAGTYTLIVSDVNGCDDTLTFIMTDPEPISLVAVNAPSFCGLSNGTIDLTVNGGSGFYNFVWTDGNTGLVIGNSEDLFNITGGVYIVAVTDTNGCTEIDSVIVGDKPPVVITGTTTPTNCNGSCNGAINVTLVGDGPYIINWTGPNGFTSTDEDLVALCNGTYIITVQDGNSCTVVDTFVITAPNAIGITVVANNAATCSASNGSIDISVEGGSGTYSYSWSGPNNFTSTSQDLTGLAEGCYVVTVTDAGGCSSTQTICVGSVSNLVINTTPVNVSCNGLNNGSACAEATGTTPPVSYLWSNGDTTQCTDSLAPGTYVVTITDANGCSGSDTIVITEPDAIVVAADIPVYPNGYNVSVADGSDGSIDLTVSGGTVPYTYDWNLPAPNDILEDQVSLPADTYIVVITDANGCTITEEYILTEPPLIVLPTGFSPDNGDGLNDYYVIHGIEGLTDNKFTVFNRWGQVIFEKEGYQNDWAGTNFSGKLMPDGTYFILFTVNVPNQGNLTFKATVELRHNLGK